jgi:hypothetical protein
MIFPVARAAEPMRRELAPGPVSFAVSVLGCEQSGMGWRDGSNRQRLFSEALSLPLPVGLTLWRLIENR